MGLLRPWALMMIGAWFALSAWAVSAAALPLARWNFAACGGAMALLGTWATLEHPRERPWRALSLTVCSAWMAASPWLLAYGVHHPFDAGLTLVAGVLGLVDGASLLLWRVGQSVEAPRRARPTRGSGGRRRAVAPAARHAPPPDGPAAQTARIPRAAGRPSSPAR